MRQRYGCVILTLTFVAGLVVTSGSPLPDNSQNSTSTQANPRTQGGVRNTGVSSLLNTKNGGTLNAVNGQVKQVKVPQNVAPTDSIMKNVNTQDVTSGVGVPATNNIGNVLDTTNGVPLDAVNNQVKQVTIPGQDSEGDIQPGQESPPISSVKSDGLGLPKSDVGALSNKKDGVSLKTVKGQVNQVKTPSTDGLQKGVNLKDVGSAVTVPGQAVPANSSSTASGLQPGQENLQDSSSSSNGLEVPSADVDSLTNTNEGVSLDTVNDQVNQVKTSSTEGLVPGVNTTDVGTTLTVPGQSAAGDILPVASDLEPGQEILQNSSASTNGFGVPSGHVGSLADTREGVSLNAVSGKVKQVKFVKGVSTNGAGSGVIPKTDNVGSIADSKNGMQLETVNKQVKQVNIPGQAAAGETLPAASDLHPGQETLQNSFANADGLGVPTAEVESLTNTKEGVSLNAVNDQVNQVKTPSTDGLVPGVNTTDVLSGGTVPGQTAATHPSPDASGLQPGQENLQNSSAIKNGVPTGHVASLADSTEGVSLNTVNGKVKQVKVVKGVKSNVGDSDSNTKNGIQLVNNKAKQVNISGQSAAVDPSQASSDLQPEQETSQNSSASTNGLGVLSGDVGNLGSTKEGVSLNAVNGKVKQVKFVKGAKSNFPKTDHVGSVADSKNGTQPAASDLQPGQETSQNSSASSNQLSVPTGDVGSLANTGKGLSLNTANGKVKQVKFVKGVKTNGVGSGVIPKTDNVGSTADSRNGIQLDNVNNQVKQVNIPGQSAAGGVLPAASDLQPGQETLQNSDANTDRLGAPTADVGNLANSKEGVSLNTVNDQVNQVKTSPTDQIVAGENTTYVGSALTVPGQVAAGGILPAASDIQQGQENLQNSYVNSDGLGVPSTNGDSFTNTKEGVPLNTVNGQLNEIKSSSTDGLVPGVNTNDVGSAVIVPGQAAAADSPSAASDLQPGQETSQNSSSSSNGLGATTADVGSLTNTKEGVSFNTVNDQVNQVNTPSTDQLVAGENAKDVASAGAAFGPSPVADPSPGVSELQQVPGN